MKRIKILFTALITVMIVCAGAPSYASSPTDEILDYEITVDVNDDATINMKYHFDWKVLESDGIGPVRWVKIGIPNANYITYDSISDNIESIIPDNDSSQFYFDVYFDRDYYEDEIISFDFEVVQDYMYVMNELIEGETVFYLTPGWFSEISVDRLVVRWNADKASSWGAGALNKDGYLTWEMSLNPGQTQEFSVTYPNDAFNFNVEKNAYNGSFNINDYGYDYNYKYYDYDYDYYNYNSYNNNDSVNGEAFFIVFVWIIIIGIVAALKAKSYSDGASFSAKGETKKKITRTLIKYYPTCPGCGAVRAENQEKCEYCGRSFIESEEVVEEKEIKEPSKYDSEGTYRYSDLPNTYIRVHVTHVPVSRPSTTRSSCVHSSCAHSSCACAHSCACACACACAGGGRAGCSTKDFYNTALKLKQLEKKCK